MRNDSSWMRIKELEKFDHCLFKLKVLYFDVRLSIIRRLALCISADPLIVGADYFLRILNNFIIFKLIFFIVLNKKSIMCLALIILRFFLKLYRLKRKLQRLYIVFLLHGYCSWYSIYCIGTFSFMRISLVGIWWVFLFSAGVVTFWRFYRFTALWSF